MALGLLFGACFLVSRCVQEYGSLLGRHVIGEVTLRDGRVATAVQYRQNLVDVVMGEVATDVDLRDLNGVMHRVRVYSGNGVLHDLKMVQEGEYLLVGEGRWPLDTIDVVMRPKRIRGAWTAQYIRDLKRGRTVRFRDPKSAFLHTVEPVSVDSSLKVGDMVLCKLDMARVFDEITAIDGDRVEIGGGQWVRRRAIFGKSFPAGN